LENLAHFKRMLMFCLKD